MPLRDILGAVFVAFVYGVSFVAIRAAVTDLPPLLVTGYRFFFAAIPLIFFLKRPLVPFVPLAAYGFMQGTVMFGLAFTAIAWGMPAGLTSLVVQLQVFFTILLAALLMSELPNAKQIAGMTLGFAGIFWLGAQGGDVPFVPFLLVVGAALAWGVANMIAKYARPQPGEALSFIVWSSLFGALPLFVLSMILEETTFALPPHNPLPTTWIAIAFLAIVTQLWAFTLWVKLLNRHPAPKIMPFALLIPVFGLSSTSFVFDERLTWQTGFASALILAGLALAIFRPVKTSPR